MQLPDSTDIIDNLPENPGQKLNQPKDKNNDDDNDSNSTAETAAVDGNDDNNDRSNGYTDGDSVLDVSGKSVEFSILGDSKESVDGLYLYKNVFNLIPKSVGALSRLRNLKFFGNEINLFPSEVGGLVGLECLQVKISSPGFNGMSLSKLKGLKELELSRVPPRSSVLTLLSEISGLKCLTRLSVCYFSIRYLPPEIGCLKNLEYLDLSFNKIKSLPIEISYLNDLILLKVANNKLVELPLGLSSLQRLENLDLSNNRLTSLGSLELSLMPNLQTLNLQYNKLVSCFQTPSWICCNLEGNGRAVSSDEFTSSSVEMDVYETTGQDTDGSVSYNGSHKTSSGILTVPLANSRYIAARRSSKRWKRRHYLQQRARQERLNNSRKWKGEGHAEVHTVKAGGESPGDNDVLASSTGIEAASELVGKDDDKPLHILEAKNEKISSVRHEDDTVTYEKRLEVKNSTSDGFESRSKGSEDECSRLDASIEQDEGSSSEIYKSNFKSKRQSDRDLSNPKPCKSRKPTDYCSNLSRKYSTTSFCGTEDYLPDGFYDAGRDRPFMPLSSYEQIFHLESREVILVDRERDEELDAIALSAQALVIHLKHLNGLAKDKERVPLDNFQIASLLALFISDHFGGSDRSGMVERTRKAVSGSNYKKPFICTCTTGNGDSVCASNKTLNTVEDIVFSDLCERSLRSIKSRRKSIVVPLGTLQFGVCRHRALLMKYLCDRMEPPVPCELIRGYLDFMPHAWNIIPIKRGDSWVRLVVDACHPHDIREEIDPEYFCRYVPLSRTKVPVTSESIPVLSSFPSMTTSDEIERVASSSLLRCKFGSLDAAAKVRTLEINGASLDEVKNFEYSCLGEVRILGALKHACIVEMYGHQITSKWISVGDGEAEHRILQSTILMEYIKGGSLKTHIEKLAKAGEKHIPVDFALCIARDVASALAELHSKHIIHRDIKSENILIDLDGKRVDGSPVVKLCDFDRAVPLRSSLHTCCIAHLGIPPPDVCVGTPRWMAPEVLGAMHKRNPYGLEVDIWSFGCLLYELLTLQVPYSGLSELHIHELIQMGERPRLPEDLEALESTESVMTQSGTEAETETLRFLVDIFRKCTEENPVDRPTANNLYDMLVKYTNDFRNSS
ncbi:Mitogen-activated protein kinase kinase kinase A [Gossypium arboreum]|uniref:Mitogen-activated protein kinase kinase kinase A n=1 Tax=Gossypium arboreum TaxID=29729 RepID=A0A0B0NQH1_GOSAR|nr:Mitogen-activated protein kinase kinase kinase A [Gossypium arboreum]